MDGRRFDALTKAAGDPATRRDWLRLAGAVAAATLGPAAPVGAAGCSADADCEPCHTCANGRCEKVPAGTSCLGHGTCTKKGRCKLPAPSVKFTVEPPCATASVAGLKPGTNVAISMLSPCYGGGAQSGPVGSSGQVTIGPACGNCTHACPADKPTTWTLTVDGTANNSGKPFHFDKTKKKIACVGLPVTR